MQASAVPERAGVAASEPVAADARPAKTCGNVNPSADNPPACKKVRRAIGVEAFQRDRIIGRFSEVLELVRAPSAEWLIDDSFRHPDSAPRTSPRLVMLPSRFR